MTIDQIYCTHCTYGSSALEQREGELADRVLGYSARAGSLERNELRGVYRQVERFLYYYLPSDSPPEERLRLDAATAPCRMFYAPSIGRLQILGHVVYRRHDTAGRAGSYFAHVLFGEKDGQPWPVLDCLRLWDAPWVVEDSPELVKSLPALDGLDDLLQGRPAAIDDDVLLGFLRTPSGQAFNDPRRVVPERWRTAPQDERIELLIDVVQGYIELGSNRRDSVLVVCEPSLAALVFYGVARLLPPGAVRAGVSFSTYEPSPDRLPVALAATTLYAPETTDIKAEAYRRRGYVYNTYLRKCSDAGRPRGSYARLMVETLLAEGWGEVDALLKGFAEAGCGKLEELESLAQTQQLAPRLLDPAAPLDPAVWARSAVAERYLSAAVERQLAAADPHGPQLRALVGSSRQVLVAELAAARPGAESSPSVRFLLRSLPPERTNELLSSQRVSWEAKLEALSFQLSNSGRFPDDCEMLWTEVAGAGNRAAGRTPLLSAALARLTQPVLESLRTTVPDGHDEAFIVALARACPVEPRRQAALERFLAELVATLDEQHLVGLLSRCRAELQASYPRPEPLLAHRLAKLLYELPDRPREFAQRLDALSGWVDQFAEPGLAEQRLAQWRKLHSILQSLRGGEAKKSAGFFKGKTRPDYKGLAEALRKAMPDAVYADDLAGSMKKKRLRELGTYIVGSPDFLPPAVWNRITRYFEYGDWAEGAKSLLTPARRSPSGKPLSKRGGKPKRGSPGGWFGRWSVYLAAVGLGSSLGMLILFGIWHFRPPTTVAEQAEEPGQESTGERPSAPKKKAPTADRRAAETKREDGHDVKKTPVKTDSTSTPSQTTKSKASTPDAQRVDKPGAKTSKRGADDRSSHGKSTPAADGPPEETTSSPDEPEAPREMPESTETQPSDPAKTPAAADSPAAPATSDSVPPASPDAVEAPRPTTGPRAESFPFPPPDSFETKTRSIPESKRLEWKLFGRNFPQGTGLGDKFLIVPETNAPGRMVLCRVPQRKADRDEIKATPDNSLGTFHVSPGRLAFQWIGSQDKVDERSRKWLCDNGFVLELTTDAGPLYFPLYQPKILAAIEFGSKSIATIKPSELGDFVAKRNLRLGAGKVYFDGGVVREFDEAPDDDGANAPLKPAPAHGDSAPLDVHLKKTNGIWKLEVLAQTPVATGDKPSAEAPTEDDPAAGFPKPKSVSAILYRLVELDKSTKVRVDEVIIKKPLPRNPHKKRSQGGNP